MKVAIPKKGNEISSHYGQSEGFVIFEVDFKNGTILSEKETNSSVKGCHSASLLSELKVDTVIASGIGENAVRNLEQHNIEVLVGVNGNIHTIIKKFMDNSLIINESTCCGNDHEHEDDHECCGHHH